MTHQPIIPVILSGGAGVRLWPLSRAAKPKQFLQIVGNHSLIQQTVMRCSGSEFDQNPIIVSGESQRFLVAEDLRSINVHGEIVLEPMRRDSCAAVAAGCLVALKRSPDAMVLVLAADHLIVEKEKFVSAVLEARVDAEKGYLTTFGIRPNQPATGYGYISPGSRLRVGGSFLINKFVEKPDQKTAETYISEGYLWNSGNFLFRAAAFIGELKLHSPAVFAAVDQSVRKATKDSDYLRLEPDAFSRSPQISVDYAVMEKTEKAAVYAVNYQWNDIGTWDAVHDILGKDERGNSKQGRAVVVDGQNNLAYSSGPLTTLVGVEDLIVVTTADAVFVGRRGDSEKLKKLVAELKARNYPEAD
jgi:mannose-1-phosphate guanylyltransferase / mannose-6-phosphate isomerase